MYIIRTLWSFRSVTKHQGAKCGRKYNNGLNKTLEKEGTININMRHPVIVIIFFQVLT